MSVISGQLLIVERYVSLHGFLHDRMMPLLSAEEDETTASVGQPASAPAVDNRAKNLKKTRLHNRIASWVVRIIIAVVILLALAIVYVEESLRRNVNMSMAEFWSRMQGGCPVSLASTFSWSCTLICCSP